MIDGWQGAAANRARTWFAAQVTLDYVRAAFKSGSRAIRIACGFFTLRGWGLVRGSARGKQVFVLVGLDDPGQERARLALVQEIMRDLATGLDRDRRAAVYDLVQRMRAGQAHVVDARAMNHHAKLYLVDHSIAIITSANTTGSGFLEQVESGTVETDGAEVSRLAEQFDEYFRSAYDITDELLRILEEWLVLVRPWDIYLKTMLALEALPHTSRTYKRPLPYQVDMIAQTLRQIRESRGSLLVASTGLGKTVVATHVAIRLLEAGEITNVMVIGPKAVEPQWRGNMRDAAIPFDYFIHQSFDWGDPARDASLREFLEIALTSADKRWLVVIDESHGFRKRYSEKLVDGVFAKSERGAFTRLLAFVRENGARVLELTGSPYAVDIDNLNDQLLLLPHTAERRTLFDDATDDERAWRIEDIDEFVSLPVASQLTTPHVAKYYCAQDERGLYLMFGSDRRYLPNVTLHRVDVPLPWEEEMTSVLRALRTTSRDRLRRQTIEVQARIAWSSSPWALSDVLRSVVDTPGGPHAYHVTFAVSRAERLRRIRPVLSHLERMNWANDSKFLALCRVLEAPLQSGRKILVYCERLATAVYLAEGLDAALASRIRVASTVTRAGQDGYKLKTPHEVQELIRQFAPTANAGIGPAASDVNVLIATDAHGVGLDLQDASVVVNYDTAWTPIEPTQRAGRVLRFWAEPRTLDLYTFVPTLAVAGGESSPIALAVGRRWENLIKRHGHSQKLIDLAVLPTGLRTDIEMPTAASTVTIESGDLDFDELADAEISPYFQHTSHLQVHREYAEQLRNDIMSAAAYKGKHPLIYVLLQHAKGLAWPVYDLTAHSLRTPTSAQLLDLVQATEETPIAFVAPDIIEAATDACIRAWCDRHHVPETDVERVCALYLKPQGDGDGLREWLSE